MFDEYYAYLEQQIEQDKYNAGLIQMENDPREDLILINDFKQLLVLTSKINYRKEYSKNYYQANKEYYRSYYLKRKERLKLQKA